jgi:phosphatidylglycerol:prolipoprotein diacylglycerol transferase
MHPILFELGGVTVHTYGALGAVAFLLGAFIALKRGEGLGVLPEATADLIFWTSLVGLVGSRLLFVYQNPDGIETIWDVVNIRKGGMVFYGSLLVGVPFGTLWMRMKGMPILAMWDVMATVMPLAHGISRLGCYAAGCCYGSETDASWAVVFTDDLAVAPHNVALHPVQLYEAALLFVVAAIVNLAWTRRRQDGQVIGLYLGLYAVGRSVMELYRGDVSRGLFLPDVFGELMTYSQGISLLGLVAGGLLIWMGRRAGPSAQG